MEKTLVLSGGCFWCTEAVFQMLKGVSSVEPGYAGGDAESATYERVASGTTRHAEAIRITYDSDTISYGDLLTVFFGTHDPTTLNRQSNDIGTQYRSAIFYQDEGEKDEAKAFINDLKEEGIAIVTTLEPLEEFYPAETEHQDYYKTNKDAPYCQIIIEPKIEKLRKRFAELLAH